MPSVSELQEQYREFDDLQLYATHQNKEGYSVEGQEALDLEVNNRGGERDLKLRVAQILFLNDERKRVRIYARSAVANGLSKAEMIKEIHFEHLTNEEIEGLLDIEIEIANAAIEDVKVKPKTIYGSLLGICIGSLIAAPVWAGQLILGGTIMIFIVLGVGFMNFFIIKSITGQSENNVVVVLASAIAFIVGAGLGFLIFQIVGPSEIFWN